MGDNPRSPTLDLHQFFKMPKTKSKSLKEVREVCKSIVSRKHHHFKKTKEESTTSPSFDHDDIKRVDEDIWSPKFLLRDASRRSKTPTPASRPLSRIGSRRCTTPTSLSRSCSSGKQEKESTTSSIKRMMSRRGTSSGSLSRNYRQQLDKLEISEPELVYHAGSGSPTNVVIGSSGEIEHIPAVSLSGNLTRHATTPIIFSQTTVRRKPPEVEKKIHCSLEDLCFGCKKKIKVTRDVIRHPGVILQEQEILKIEVKPGWRKGTKITFEGKGDEKPGYLPADIIFLIDEKQHPLFRRHGNNLEICVEIPLVDALTGCNITIPLLGGESMTLTIEDTVIYPGYEKVIEGQGMPNPKNTATRGDLHVKFLIDFPKELSDEQREEAVSILEDCCQ